MAIKAQGFYAADRTAWRQWLAEHHDTEQSVWLIYDKGESRKMTIVDIVEEALCFGWIDSLAGSVDTTKSKIYMSRRKPRSTWSKVNKLRIEGLIKAKLMQPAGLAAIEVGKANGAWDQLTLSDDLILPTLLKALLDKNEQAKNSFEAFSDSSKRIILQWIYAAKRDETRNKRIEETVSEAAKGLKVK